MPTSDDSIRVLHVDDEPGFAEVAAAHLERECQRLDVETAMDARAGLERLDEGVDCVVSDYHMPGQNGIEFLEAVRGRGSDLRFGLYTVNGSEEVASEAISAGVTDYLQKETGTGQCAVLANRIENAVDRHRSRRDLEASRERLSLFVEQSPLGVLEYDEALAPVVSHGLRSPLNVAEGRLSLAQDALERDDPARRQPGQCRGPRPPRKRRARPRLDGGARRGPPAARRREHYRRRDGAGRPPVGRPCRLRARRDGPSESGDPGRRCRRSGPGPAPAAPREPRPERCRTRLDEQPVGG